MKWVAILIGTASVLAAGAVPVTARTQSTAVAPRPSQALAALFAASNESDLKRNPLGAMFRGDMRYAGQFGDGISDAYYAAERAAATADLAVLKRIDRVRLTPSERISYDVFQWQRTNDLRGLQPELLALTAVRPIDHFGSIHTAFAELSSGDGAAPFKTVQDYENQLSRIDGFVTYIDRAIGRMREGMKSKVTQPKLVMVNVVEQLDAMLAQQGDKSSFVKPVQKFPATIPAADQARLKAQYVAAEATKIRPALVRLRTFIADEYLPQARDTVGLSAMPGGDKLYAYLASSSTTTNLTPDQIHRIGLSEVTRIQAEMAAVKQQVGFTGTLKQFFNHIRTDPKFRPESREWMQAQYVATGKKLDATLPKLFATLPKTALLIRPTPALTEKGAARGSYSRGNPDGSRPGVFNFNAYDLPSRSTPAMETLYLHEGAPGHHFQISLAQENVALPAFQRFGGNTAYVEGWGLYSETLGRELGVYTDPYQYFGYLDSQLFRAIRLVVDTGIHSKGWTRERTIQYILDNSSRGLSNATAETERYIASPGQALAYKIGQLKISELRARAEKALGPKFDIREFHSQVLMSGALPLAVLERKIDDWVKAKQ
ncbi:DUF885 domain-containing protein [Sphingomonas sp.]|uniref:DUF885 domain-containing protein n=1 Tax=Sphingomonas sp. TaxID=28214 RepID=UPI00286B4C7D|nr:DUF885 domain-containing protein [Sphingomonas sp.]